MQRSGSLLRRLASRPSALPVLAHRRCSSGLTDQRELDLLRQVSRLETRVGELQAQLPDRVPPAKRRAYDAFFRDGRSTAAIARDRDVKAATVRNYVADAVAAGLAYDWARLEDEIGARVCSAIDAALDDGKASSDIRRDVPGADYWAIKVVATHRARTRPPTPPRLSAAQSPVSSLTDDSAAVSEFRLFFV